MEWWLLIFFFSAILSLFMPIVPDFSLLLVILLLALLLIFVNKFRLIAIALFAFTWILLAGSQYQQSLVNNNLDPETLHKNVYLIQGEITNIVHTKSGSSRFNFLITHWQGLELNHKFKARLSWKGADTALLQGQRWQLAVKLKPAHGLANLGGFNYQVWLLQQQIVLTGYVKPDRQTKTSKSLENKNILLQPQTSWRQHLYQKLAVVLGDEPLGGLIMALGFGERGELTDTHWRVLSATATQHLIAISGLHIGIIAVATLIFTRIIIRFVPINLLLPKLWQAKLMAVNLRYLPVLCSCLMAWYYAYLAGFSIPTLRALVMLLLFWSIKLMTLQVSLLRWLLMAIVVIVLIWPLSLLSASFWLSISALVIIFSTVTRFPINVVKPREPHTTSMLSTLEKAPITFFKKHWRTLKPRTWHWLKTLFVMQLALTLAMLPIAASLNYQLPLAAFLANIVAVPLMSFTVIPLTLLAVVALPVSGWLAGVFSDLALLSLSWLWQWLTYLASAKWAIVSISYPQIQVMLLLLFLIALVLFFRINRAKVIVALCFSTAVIAIDSVTGQQQKDWQLSVLDVGHGLAIVIEKNQHVFLYDTGASYPSGFNMADAALLPYLKHQGYQVIDRVIISHNDNDHAGGLSHLRAQMAIKAVTANDMALIPDSYCIAGQSFTWQGLMFEVLSPTQVKGDKNDDSCVLTISDGIHRVLLSGDISIKQEKRLLNIPKMKEKLASDLLIAPHHGSKSSSSPRFLSAVAPRYAVFSAGYLNRWQMPSKEILSRYNTLDITTFNTAQVGMVTFNFNQTDVNTNDGEGKVLGSIEVISYRENMRPYWSLK